jgi:nicotinate-nucleotide adenylyltransferase
MIIPAGQPWQRDRPVASAEQRVAMARLATQGSELFCVDEREALRKGPSYTVQTLDEMRRERGRSAPLWLLLGADAFMNLQTWYCWRDLFALAHVAVAQRPGHAVQLTAMAGPLRDEYQARRIDPGQSSALAAAGAIALLALTPLEISATYIRELLRAGHDPRYLLPDSVLDYIQMHHVYTKETDET